MSAKQRARDKRRPVDLRGIVTLEEGATHAIALIDLSYDGCGIEVPIQLQEGSRVRLSIARRGIIDAEVRWYSEGRAGLTFLPELHRDGGDQDQAPRDSIRVQLAAGATVKRRGRRHYAVNVFDLSSKGLRFEYVDRPEVGETLFVALPGLQPLEGLVRWIEGTGAGIEFLNPIHPAVFDLLIEKMSADSGNPV